MRDARDADGNFLIDGDKKRYGIAELYVDVAGEDSARSVDRRRQIIEAQQYILNDSPNGILTKCRLLGRNMKNAPFTDAQDFLMQEAEKSPAKVTDLYTGQDTGIQLLILDAKDKNILRKVNGWFMYGDTNMGATEEAVLLFLKTPMNKPIFDAFKAQVYPEFAQQLNQTTATVETIPTPEVNPKKPLPKK